MKDRLNKAYEYLVYTKVVNTREELAEKMNSSRVTVSNALNGNKKYLTHSFINKFNSAFNQIINKDWLLTGEGSMLKEDSNSTTIKGNYNNVGHSNTIGSNNITSEPSVHYGINQDQIKLMELEIQSLKKQIEDKDRIIAAKDQTLSLYEKMLGK